ncbi:MAG: hypothetical protein M1831_004627 [Alyxoria varia]|nr:MAG: hypothetical protein M1831_004627 [Alyxoria varia]
MAPTTTSEQVENKSNETPGPIPPRPSANPRPRPDLSIHTASEKTFPTGDVRPIYSTEEQSNWSPLSPSPIFKSPKDFDFRNIPVIYQYCWTDKRMSAILEYAFSAKHNLVEDRPCGLSMLEFKKASDLMVKMQERDREDVVVEVDGSKLLDRLLDDFGGPSSDQLEQRMHERAQIPKSNENPEQAHQSQHEYIQPFDITEASTPPSTPALTSDKGRTPLSSAGKLERNHAFGMDSPTPWMPTTPGTPTTQPKRRELQWTPSSSPTRSTMLSSQPSPKVERTTLFHTVLSALNLTLPTHIPLILTPLLGFSRGCTKHMNLPFGPLPITLSSSTPLPTSPSPANGQSSPHTIRLRRRDASGIPSALEEKASRLRKRIDMWSPASPGRRRGGNGGHSSATFAGGSPHEDVDALVMGLKVQLCAVEWYWEVFEGALGADVGEVE